MNNEKYVVFSQNLIFWRILAIFNIASDESFNEDKLKNFKNSLGNIETIDCKAEKNFVFVIPALKVLSSAFNDGFWSAAHVN